MQDYLLTEANRNRLARAFGDVMRVDLAIDCIIEGQMGRAFVDDSEAPESFMIRTGPLCYFAGVSDSEGGRAMMANLDRYSIIMPSVEGWIELARSVHGKRLFQFPRYSFSSDRLSSGHVDQLLRSSPHQGSIAPIDSNIAAEIANLPDHFVDLSDYDSPEDFARRGIGYCLLKGREVVAAAFSSLICSRGAEMSIFVMPEFRRKGVATALACAVIKDCLERRLEPHWDAANVESCLLAEKLGYVQTGTYDAYFLTDS